ncbi:MAG TPA: hypothetical protein VF730_18190 [Terracidiphilus sp.]
MLFAQKSAFIRVAAPALTFLFLLSPVFATEAPQPTKDTVHAEGCVAAGVEAHCLVLRDLKSGHLYDLLFPAARPPVGLGIEFTGILHSGPTPCMQGIAVEVTTWTHKASIKCVPGQAGKRGSANRH